MCKAPLSISTQRYNSHPHHQTPPLSQALQVSFKYPLSMRGLREFFKSYVHTRVHYVRVDSDTQYPKVSVLLI
jgi:hypothetical protein